MPRDLEHRAAFESQGETAVRVLAQQAGPIGAEATAWLAEQQALRDEASSVKRDAREEAILSTARDANRIAESASSTAREALRIAIVAAIAAVVAAIYPMFKK
jgi:hypothetical protein